MESIKELRKLCQEKGYREHDSIRFHRFFSIYVTRIFLMLGLGPNFISFLSFLMGIIGGFFYFKSLFLLGSIFFFLFYLLDNVDGEVARYRKLSSRLGYWLDTSIGHLLYPVFFFTLGLGIFNQTGEVSYIVLGAVASISKLVERSVPQIKNIEKGDVGILKRNDISSLKMWVSYFAKYSVITIIVIMASLLGQVRLFLWFYAPFLLFLALGKVILTGWRIYRYNR